MVGKIKGAVMAEAKKISVALVTWGFGVVAMIAYCVLVYWLKHSFGIYVSMAGAMVFLAFAFFFIDLWWRLSHKKYE